MTPSHSLPSSGTILRDCITLYRQRFPTLLNISLIPLAANLLLVVLTTNNRPDPRQEAVFHLTPYLDYPLRQTPPNILAAMLITLLTMWSSLALFYALLRPKELDAVSAYRESWPHLPRFIWALLLTLLVATFGFYLLIFPGLLFLSWFGFASYLAVEKGLSGPAALRESRKLVGIRDLEVIGRFAYFILISIVFSVVIALLENTLTADASLAATVLHGLTITVYIPATIIYGFLIYQYLQHPRRPDKLPA
jgi:hypothetical protein